MLRVLPGRAVRVLYCFRSSSQVVAEARAIPCRRLDFPLNQSFDEVDRCTMYHKVGMFQNNFRLGMLMR